MPLPGSTTRALILLAAILAPGAASAAGITGTVRDARTDLPVASAAIVATSADHRAGTTAASDGSFRILDLPEGRYEIRVSRLGYTAFMRPVAVSGDKPFPLDVRLEPSVAVADSIEVRGTRVDDRLVRPGVLTLGGEEIRALPAFGESDPIRTLQLLPGVQAASDFSTGLYVRGGGPDQTLVQLDGVPIYNPTHAFGLFSTFNSDVIDEVSLYKGGYPARYGGRLTAVLDVTTREGDEDEIHGQAGLSIVAGRLSVGGPVGGGTWMLSGRRTYLDPVLDALRTEENDLPSYYFYDGNGKLVLPLSPGSRLLLDGYLGQDDLRVDLDEGFFFDLRWNNRAGSVAVERDLGTSAVGTLKTFISRYSSTTTAEFFSTPVAFGNRLEDVTVLADVDWKATDAQRFRGGIQLSQYDFSFQSSFNRDTSLVFAADPFDVSTFVENEWTPTNRITVQDGLRVRYFSEGERWLFEPRVSASLPASDTVTLQVGSGLYHQYIQLISTEGFSGGDFYLPLDETVEPGFSWQNVIGARWDPSATWRFSTEVYGSRLRNLVLLETDNTADESGTASDTVFRSGGTGWAAGIELFAEKRVGAFRGWIGYGLGWTRRTFDDVNGGREFPPKYDRRHDVKAVALIERGKWQYSGSFLLASGQAFTPATARYGVRDPATGMFTELVLPGERNAARLEPYHRLDVSATRSFRLFGYDAEWVFQVFNLYGRRNEWFVQYDIQDGDFDAEVVKMLPMIPSAGINFKF